MIHCTNCRLMYAATGEPEVLRELLRLRWSLRIAWAAMSDDVRAITWKDCGLIHWLVLHADHGLEVVQVRRPK